MSMNIVIKINKRLRFFFWLEEVNLIVNYFLIYIIDKWIHKSQQGAKAWYSGVAKLRDVKCETKVPFGPKTFQNIEWPMPNILMGNVPGFETMATSMMKETFKKKKNFPKKN